ncbi:MAG: MerR family transcriptional regulator [Elusimicrobia bacterium]|nr:MerR family transcriptional regulator [Elusimicrobiota bacterium]
MTASTPEKKYYSICEISRAAGLPEYTIRYWEAEFGLLKPIRLESGHRRYTDRDVRCILKIKDLVYKNGMTLQGAKKLLTARTRASARNIVGGAASPKLLKLLREAHNELSQIIKEC